jgi:hypothetical protein
MRTNPLDETAPRKIPNERIEDDNLAKKAA